MKRTAARLADGRQIFYFDEADDASRVLKDLRVLPERAAGAQLRYDAALDEWVTVASHRQERTHLPPTDECPLCPSTEQRRTEIPSSSYDVVVFENRFSSFTPDARSDGVVAAAPFSARPGFGRCEVVCFTSDHMSRFSELTPGRARTVVEAWVDRTRELSEIDHVEQVFCFENRGEEIGVTLAHPHGQIYAYPFVTPRTRRMLDSARAYRERTGSDLFEDLLAAEQRDGARVVARNAAWTAFVPFAARWPVEVHLYPNRRVLDLPDLTDGERDDFVAIYREVLCRMEGLFADSMPYIAAWHQAPVRVDRDLAYLHMEVFSIRRAPGKLKYLAGSESAMGAFINDVVPEQAAQMLRDVVLR
jgi:UDPglucose--hexose-1-phosphate uridylyltransferase